MRSARSTSQVGSDVSSQSAGDFPAAPDKIKSPRRSEYRDPSVAARGRPDGSTLPDATAKRSDPSKPSGVGRRRAPSTDLEMSMTAVGVLTLWPASALPGK